MVVKRFLIELPPDELDRLRHECERNQTQRRPSHEQMEQVNDRFADCTWMDKAERVLDEAEQRLGSGK